MSEMQGKKFDQNKPRMSLLPKGALSAVIRVLEFGATKYQVDNWKHVPDAKVRYYDAMQRHIDAWWHGEQKDRQTADVAARIVEKPPRDGPEDKDEAEGDGHAGAAGGRWQRRHQGSPAQQERPAAGCGGTGGIALKIPVPGGASPHCGITGNTRYYRGQSSKSLSAAITGSAAERGVRLPGLRSTST